jgi:DNA-binding CsgD family transcriptional regulator/mannose-6-phosphate isomerase-like protein (cupin superfamily)
MSAVATTDRTAWTDVDAPAIIVVDRARRILFKNRFADSILGSDQTLKERNCLLGSPLPSVDRELRALIEQPAGRVAPPRMMFLPRPKKVPLLAMITSLQMTPDAPGALLLAWDPNAIRLIPLSTLMQLFAMTEAEALVALATYDGRTPREIADARSCSINTVRTHLSRVFMKCGVRRQAELVRLLADMVNMCNLAEGIRTGMDVERRARNWHGLNLSTLQFRNAIAEKLKPSHGLQAVVKIRSFPPGQGTLEHYHTHGHEVHCVLEGELTTFSPGGAQLTSAGDARYIGEGIVHRGQNLSSLHALQILSIDVRQQGRPFRVDVAGAP